MIDRIRVHYISTKREQFLGLVMNETIKKIVIQSVFKIIWT